MSTFRKQYSEDLSTRTVLSVVSLFLPDVKVKRTLIRTLETVAIHHLRLSQSCFRLCLALCMVGFKSQMRWSRPFVCACFPCVCIGFLQDLKFSHTVQSHAREVNWRNNSYLPSYKVCNCYIKILIYKYIINPNTNLHS